MISSESYTIVFDWGSSNLRASLLNSSREILEKQESPFGIRFVPEKNFESILLELLDPWISQLPSGQLSLVALGMITSRNGWVEVPYVQCPASVEDLAKGMLTQPLRNQLNLHFIPGIIDTSSQPFSDVIRGEETQIIGLGVDKDQIIVLPGTHSKWVRTLQNRIHRFQTFVTGEIYDVIQKHSFIASLQTEGTPSDQAFERGAKDALADYPQAEALLSALFNARKGVLSAQIATDDVAEYTSGLLIGHEFRQAAQCGWFTEGESIIIVGNNRLCARYQQVAQWAGLQVELGRLDAAEQGAMTLLEAKGK